MNVRIPANRGITCASSGLYGGPATARCYSVRPALPTANNRSSSLGTVGSLVGRLMAVLVLAALLSAPAGAATFAKGIDVSHYNGAIDWTQVATASYRFVYTKATEGSMLIDPTYSINRQGAKAFGLRLGAYHFARPAGSSDVTRIANAIAQADFLLTVAQPQTGELPPVLDLETKNGLSQTALQTWTDAWLGEIAARTGVSAVVYTSPNFWKTAMASSTSVAAAGHRL